MTAYATWEEYNEVFLLGDEPAIQQAGFPRWERRARTSIDAATFNRLHEPDVLEKHRNAVIMCVCELAEYYASNAVQESRGIASVSVTGQSITYDKSGRAKEEREIITRNLINTGLLHSGAV